VYTRSPGKPQPLIGFAKPLIFRMP
jgi:hypothetical protein